MLIVGQNRFKWQIGQLITFSMVFSTGRTEDGLGWLAPYITD